NGAFNALDNADIGGSGSPGRFVNAGTFNKMAPGTTTITRTFDNSGSVNTGPGGGTLALSGGGTGTGAFSAAALGVIDFAGGTYDFNFGTAVSGAGTARFSGATTNFNMGTYSISET